jgi:heat shock protein beta
MTTRRLSMLISLVACGALLAPVAPAEAKKKANPTIKRVTPMRVTVGKKITIRGVNFSSSRKRNTVMFIAPSKRTAFAKPSKASRKKLVVKVPAAVERLLLKSNGTRPATRFKLRVVTKGTKGYGKLSSKRVSPVIVSSLKSGQPASCGAGGDWDRDGLANSREASLKLDPCLKDTDGDGAEDYFEVESALDLNQRAVPYPAARPYPNALFPDGGSDYDGDGLTNSEESHAWAHPSQGAGGGLQAYSGSAKAPAFSGPYGGVPFFGGHGSLNYSDGQQATVSAGGGSPEYRTYLDLDGSGSLTDDERDADGDGLSNGDEIRGLMYQPYYSPVGECAAPGNDYTYRPLLPRDMQQVDWLDSDSDGDGVWDGNDDQDNDGVSNVDEILPPYQDCKISNPAVFLRGPIDNARDGSSVLRAPYNPCLPDGNSPVCARYGGA